MQEKDIKIDKRTQKDLIRDERFDVLLYQKFSEFAKGDFRSLLEELIEVERKHVEFWETFFDRRNVPLDFSRRLQLMFMTLGGRIFGEKGMHLILEEIGRAHV